jgi:hypothetical protein
VPVIPSTQHKLDVDTIKEKIETRCGLQVAHVQRVVLYHTLTVMCTVRKHACCSSIRRAGWYHPYHTAGSTTSCLQLAAGTPSFAWRCMAQSSKLLPAYPHRLTGATAGMHTQSKNTNMLVRHARCVAQGAAHALAPTIIKKTNRSYRTAHALVVICMLITYYAAGCYPYRCMHSMQQASAAAVANYF